MSEPQRRLNALRRLHDDAKRLCLGLHRHGCAEDYFLAQQTLASIRRTINVVETHTPEPASKGV